MKNASTFLKALMAIVIAILPLQADAKPKKDDKKGGGAAAEVRKSESRKANKPSARKASSQPKRNVNKAPSQRKQKASNAPSRPKQSVSKAQKRSPKMQSKAERPRKSPATSQKRQVSSSQKAPKRNFAQKQKTQNAQVRPNRGGGNGQGKARAKDREERTRSDVGQAARKGEKSAQRIAAGKGDGRGMRADSDLQDRVARLAERRNGDKAGGRRQDLAGDIRERGEKRGAGQERNARSRGNKEDRRPERNASVEERQRRAERAQVREKYGKERRQQLAQRNERKRDRVDKFRKERNVRVAALKNHRQTLRTTRTRVDREYVQQARTEIREYWDYRGDDVRYHSYDRCDDLFDDDWWEDRRWRSRPILVSNPWWWWQPAEWSTVNVFLNAGWSEPVMYDYGTDVIYDDTAVYYHGEPVGTPVEYSQSVIQLANPTVEVIAEAPVVEEEWTPLGVWALVQEEQGDAVMFFQLSVNKTGLISGAYVNVVSGEELPVVGQVDRATQRAAWHIGDRTEKVFEAGMTNLTQQQASCLVHIAPGEMQPWLLVRMESPELPDQPATLSQVDEVPLIP